MNNRQRAMATIKQLNKGEWVFQWDSVIKMALVAKKDGNELWCGNGGWYTDIDHSNAFGFFWRHIVWFSGLKKAKKAFEKEYKDNALFSCFGEEQEGGQNETVSG